MKEKLRRTLALLCSSLMLGTSVVAIAACDGCDDEEETGGTCTHQWGEGVVETEATCYRDGKKVFTCELCNETKSEAISGGHEYEQSVVAATCIRDGATTYTCKRCGDTHRDISARANGHDTTNAVWTSGEDELVSGCTYNHVETATCNTCSNPVTHTETFENHTWYVEITKAATCKEAGEKTYSCSVEGCDAENTAIYVDENAHSWVLSDTQSETDNVITYVCTHDSTHTKTVYSAKTSTAATVPSAALKEAGEVELQNAAIKMDNSVLSQLGDADVDISVTEADKNSLELSDADKEKLGNAPVYDFSMSTAGNAVSQFNGKVTVTVPYTLQEGDDPENIAIWYIADNGKTETIAATYSYNAEEGQGYASFETNHFSYYTVIRMSPAERCAFYGHDNVTEVVVASCNQQGYTKTECTRCHKITRDNFTAALKHNHTPVVTAPTCSKKGYTTYTCTNCGDKYISDYKATTAHTYRETKKEASCTAAGYTLHTCEVCQYSYTDSETPLKAHTYVNGNCSVCGRKDPSITGNFYFNLIESIATAETYYVEIDEFVVDVKYSDYDGDKTVIKNAKMMLSIDETGFVGKGEAIAELTETYKGKVYTDTTDSVMVFRDGMMYLYALQKSESNSGKESYKMLQIVDQAQMFGTGSGSISGGASGDNGNGGNMGGGDIIVDGGVMEDVKMPKATYMIKEETPAMSWVGILGMLGEYSEDITALLEGVQNQENSPANNMIKGIVEYFFVKEEVQDGYKFTLDKTRAHAVYTTLTQAKGWKLFDNIFGEGAFEKTVQYLKDMLTMTVAEMEADVVSELGEWGIDKTVLYGLIESITGATVDDMLADYKQEQIYALINGYIGEEATVEDYVSMIDEYANMLREATALELIAPIFAKEGIEITQELVDEVGQMIQQYIDKLANSYVQFKTDKAGWLMSFDMHLDKFSVDAGDATCYVDGDMSFVINGSYTEEYDHVISQANGLFDAFERIETTETEDGYFFTMNGETYFWSTYKANGNGYYDYYDYLYPTTINNSTKKVVAENVSYNGQTCNKAEVSINYLWKLEEDDDYSLSLRGDCSGWWRTNCDFETQRVTQVYIYEDKAGNIIGIELVNPDQWYVNDWQYVYLYHNATTGEYALNSQHDYVLMATVKPNGCEYGTYTYECSVCGDVKTETYGDGHKEVYEYALKPGSTSCEEGAIVTTKCATCGDVLFSREVKYHDTYKQEVKVGHSDVCGDIYLTMSNCACGQNKNFGELISDCQFSYIDGVRRCAVLGCGFEYTHTDHYEYIRENGTCYRIRTETYAFPNVTYTDIDKYAQHDTRWSSTTDAEGYKVETYTCQLCGEVTSQYRYKYDQWGRTIYSEYVLEGYRWERVYDEHCNYIETYYYEDGSTHKNSGTNHPNWNTYHDYGKCTQYYQYVSQCEACGASETTWHEPDRYWWYDEYRSSHDWEYNSAKDTYVCNDCKTENPLGSDALITLEDMLSDGTIKVGYYNYRDIDMSAVDIEIILNYDETGNGIKLDGDLFTDKNTTPESGYDMDGYWHEYYKESGIITVNMNALYEAIQDTANSGTPVESVSVVFWVERSSVTGGEQFLLAHALTFDMSELAA